MAEMPKPGEVLVIRGRIDESGRFVSRRCGSTYHIRQWPRVEQSSCFLELLDGAGQPIHRALAKLERENTCDILDAERHLVTGYIGLRPEAEYIQLRNSDLVLWRSEIPPPPSIEFRVFPDDLNRDEAARLRFELSPPGDGAYLQIIYQWGERRFHTIDFVPPQVEARIDLRTSPGGNACRFVVIYSNGLRSAIAASRRFALEMLGPSVKIVEPAGDAVVTFGQHLTLQGQVVDLERTGGARNEDLTWWIDGNPAGRGSISGVDGLAPGQHRVVLRYGSEQDWEAETIITVQRAAVPIANEWEEFHYF